MALIGLIDCNNFFVSCERLFRPDLRCRPVVVLSGNDGCVVARSQEVKDNGIPMGVPYFQIKDKLQEMECEIFSSNFTLYRDVSRRVFNIIKKELGTVEQYSIDECFFSIESEEVGVVADSIRHDIWQQVGIPVSVGIAGSKTLAKIAVGRAKKEGGVAVLKSSDIDLNQLPLMQVWGVGNGRSRRFSEFGIKSAGDLVALPSSKVGQLFGIAGVQLWSELQGQPMLPLQKSTKRHKSIMSSRSFKEATTDLEVLYEAFSYHLHELIKEVSETQSLVRSVRIFAYPSRYGDYALSGFSTEVTLTLPSADIFALQKQVFVMIKDHYRSNVPYKRAGIVFNLTPKEAQSPSLFNDNSTVTSGLTEVLLGINNLHHKPVLRLGSLTINSDKYLSRRDLLSPKYSTDWTDLRVVKT